MFNHSGFALCQFVECVHSVRRGTKRSNMELVGFNAKQAYLRKDRNMIMDDHGTLSQCRKKLIESNTLSWLIATRPRRLHPKTVDPRQTESECQTLNFFCSEQAFVLSHCFPCHFVESLPPLDLANCFSMGDVKLNTACGRR